jgi:hypothetical protein
LYAAQSPGPRVRSNVKARVIEDLLGVPAVEVSAIEMRLIGGNLLAKEPDRGGTFAAQFSTEAVAGQDERALVADHIRHRPLPHVELEVPVTTAHLVLRSETCWLEWSIGGDGLRARVPRTGGHEGTRRGLPGAKCRAGRE